MTTPSRFDRTVSFAVRGGGRTQKSSDAAPLTCQFTFYLPATIEEPPVLFGFATRSVAHRFQPRVLLTDQIRQSAVR